MDANTSKLSIRAATTDTTGNGWPEPPAAWPDVMSEVQVCMYLHLHEGRTVATAKRSLRYIRRNEGLPDVGRIGGKVLFRRSAVERWLQEREARNDGKGRHLSEVA